ncbi:MAG: hypothetical protein ACUVRI_10160 [Armatimonadota bacterium]
MRHRQITRSAVLLCIVWVLGACPASALNLDLLLPVGPADEAQYDMALTSGAAHVVYRQGGNVYYATVTKDNLNWAVRNLGPGNWPTIASDINGNFIVSYENGGTIYEVGPHTDWTPSVIASGIVGGKPTLSSPFPATGWQMVVEGDIDDDSYIEVVRLVKSGTSWSAPEVLLDGWYGSGQGRYYGQTSIAAFADGSYVLGYEQDNDEGLASLSSKWVGVTGLGSPFGVDTDWNASIRVSRRGLSAISEDGSPAAVFACAVNSLIYAAINNGSGWSWLLNGYSGGSAPSFSWKGGVFADSSGILKFIAIDEQGAVIIEPLVYQGSELSGNAPLVWAMDDRFFLYRDSSGVLQFGVSFSGAVPEPSAMITMLVGLAGPLSSVVLRRKSR